MTLAPASFNFGNQGIGLPDVPRSLTLRNNTSGPISIVGVSLDPAGSAFGVDASACGSSLAAQTSCVLTATFVPASLGAQAATLTVTTSASNSPHVVALSGTGVEPLTLTPATSLSFGNQGLGSPTAAKTVTLRNNTGSDIALQPFVISGAAAAEYAMSATTCGNNLAAYATCAVSVVFTPTLLGTRGASLEFNSNASNSPHSIPLTGKGVAPVSTSPATLSFGGVGVGSTSLAKTVTLTNNTSGPVSVMDVSMAGIAAADYAWTSLCGVEVAAKASCTLSVTLAPSSTGSRPATLVIATSAANSPHNVSMTGSGQ